MADHLEARLRRVQEDFLRALPARIEEFAAVWDSGENQEVRLKRAHLLAHRLAGGAGTLGQPGLSQASKVLELEIQALLEAGLELEPATLAGLQQRTRDLVARIQDLP